MSNDFLKNLFEEIGVSPTHRFFHSRVFSALIQMRKNQTISDPLEVLWCDELDEFSRRMDKSGLQDSCSMRNILKSRALATLLIKENGELDFEALQQLIPIVENNLYSLGPERHFDILRNKHILNVLKLLSSDKQLARLLSSVVKPYANKFLEEVIRETIGLSASEPVTDTHARQATLSAWMCMLRQSLGSCFATAPAILIHDEQPHLFLQDIIELLNTGRLKRVFGGIEYTVPMSMTWGNGDLKRPFMLQDKLERNRNKFWASPGFIAAFEAVGLIDSSLSDKEKIRLSKQIVNNALRYDVKGTRWSNALEIIQAVLLHHFNLHKQHIEEYLNRPKEMLHTSLFIQTPLQSKAGKTSIYEVIRHYFNHLELAKKSFKALTDNALLRVWEFTLASFSEIKLQFTRWNLYASLGFGSDEKGGLGEFVYNNLTRCLEEYNNQVKSHHDEYEQALGHVRYLETRLRTAQTEKEIEWLKTEYQSRLVDLRHLEELVKVSQLKAKKIAYLYQFLVECYDDLFADYFQEVYDADIHEVASGPFDDSPAGFRLIFKHGRTNPALWSRIETPSQFIDSLVSFLTLTEQTIVNKPEVAGVEQEVTQLITQLIHHVRTDEFLESAFQRMAIAHQSPIIKNPLQNLDKIEKKPWVYTSGGSMTTLVGAYFRLEDKPHEVSRWVENEEELIVFLIDNLKKLTSKQADRFIEQPHRSMLMHSPTHAFLLKPGSPLLAEGWKSDMYPYSWIKQRVIEPQKRFIQSIWLEESVIQGFIQELLESIPEEYRSRAKLVFKGIPVVSTLTDFRKELVKAVLLNPSLHTPFGPCIQSDDIDSLLYSNFPYTKSSHLKEKLETILYSILPNKNLNHSSVIQNTLNSCLQRIGSYEVISSKKLQQLAKALLSLILNQTNSSLNIHELVLNACRLNNYAMPTPLIFADTNWVKDYFAFVVSPGSLSLELWAVDPIGSSGRPISYWKKWLDGSKKSPNWGIFCRPTDYNA